MPNTYTLPELRYGFGALEPHISGAIMELRLAALERSLAFNLSGRILHSIFWTNLTPKGGGQPEGDLARAIAQKTAFFDAVWNLWNWKDIAGRLHQAQALKIELSPRP